MTEALAAFGCLLKIGNGATSETFATIAEVNDISGPKFAADTVEVTSHSSTAAWKERIPTLLDAGEVSFKINFIPTNATHSNTAGLLKDFKGRTKRNFQLLFTDTSPTTWTFAAYVTGFEVAEAIDAQLTADVTLTITGAPTLAG
jgi:predicted secreted protein